MTSSHFCTNCGASLADSAKFCGECGHQTQTLPAVPVMAATPAATPVPGEPATPEVNGSEAAAGPWPPADNDAVTAAAPTATIPPAPPRQPGTPGAPPQPSRQRAPRWLLPLAVVVVLAGIVAGVLLTRGSDSGTDGDATYQKQVADVFGPVLGANKQLSRSLLRLRGTDPVAARADVQAAQQATTAAQGALAALPVPPSESKLATDARQVLDRQVAYLAAVSETLKRPSSAAAGDLQTLSSNLTSALSAAGPTVSGASSTVTGTDRLVSWAPTAARELRRDARRSKRAAERRRARAGAGSTGAGSAASNPYTNGRDCGDSTYAGPNTSCEFARNVRDAYYEAPGESASVRVFSPVTGQTYTMNCAPSGSGITCSGANNASVTF